MIPLSVPSRQPSALLFGGGFDSCLLWGWLRAYDVPLTAYFVRYGQKASAGEERAGQVMQARHGGQFEIIDLPWPIHTSAILSGQPSNHGNDVSANVLEGRNAILLLVVAALASLRGDELIYAGFRNNAGALMPDNSPAAIRAYQAVLKSALRRPLDLLAPINDWTRREVVTVGLTYEHDLLDIAYNCYEQPLSACGRCVHCVERAQLRQELGR
jgi:7-cyano-7-deazaguanine synthase in queuosine biosynthesis